MIKKTRGTGRTRRNAAGAGPATPVGAAEFKARCLELIDRVRETRAEYVVTKHGTPVAKLVPYDSARRPTRFIGSMRGTVLRYERPFDPIPGQWFGDPLLKGG